MSTSAVITQQESALPAVSAEALAAALKKPQKAKATTRPSMEWPGFLSQLNEEYTRQNAHMFTLYNNVNDYPDNEAHFLSLRKLMVMAYDDNYKNETMIRDGLSIVAGNTAQRSAQRADTRAASDSPKRICAVFVINEGLKFDSEESRKLWQDMMSAEYADIIQKKQVPLDFLEPMTFDTARFTLERWFRLTKSRTVYNKSARVLGQTLKPEATFTVVFFDCDIFLPAGNISTLNADRTAIGFFRNWALDREIGTRNKIVLVVKNLSQIHESLRGGSSGVSAILIPKPSVEDRQKYSENFRSGLAARCLYKITAGDPLKINGKIVHGVEFAPDFTDKSLAIQSAGMSRMQIEKAFNDCLNRGVALDDHMVRVIKQKCMEEEHEGVLYFTHPTHGFAQVGGHAELKAYIMEKISIPLRAGDARTCSGGMLLVGPPGTGKTFIVQAAAFEARTNFVELNLGKLLNKYVGGTEERTEMMFEAIRAAAPCVVFIDEIDVALPKREGGGDSGTGSRLTGAMLTFLSDESRLGKIVVVAATNHPENIDPAVIRSGRLGDVLPVLPPPREGEASFHGRASILMALASKHKVQFSKELQGSMTDPMVGLGRLLLDSQHIWTGAEVEAVLKDAIGLAVHANRDRAGVTMDDWTIAMDSIIPRTGQLEDMTELALNYSNNIRYCPPEWREQMKNKSALVSSLSSKGYKVD